MEKPFTSEVEVANPADLAPATGQASALHSILAWSTPRPAWQRDALRRIVTNGSLQPLDMQELEAILRKGTDAKNAAGVPVVPALLATGHIPASPTDVESINLRQVSNLKHINRLLAGQTLSFGDHLTVIYGDNGAGKSGYARVIKRACRTRGTAPELKPDAFSPAPPAGTRASCEITISTAGTPAKLTWTDGNSADPRLSRVFMFDAMSASNYLAADGPCMFTPYGLDVLPKLSAACDALASSIRSSMGTLDTRTTAALRVLQGSHKNSAVGVALAKLGPSTKKADLQALAAVTETDLQRLADLGILLTSNPKEKAQATRASKARVSALREALDARSTLLSTTSLDTLSTFQTTAKTTAATAYAFSKGWKDPGALTGTGDSYWLALWETARTFSEKSAYAQAEFPNIAADAACVLCQQPLEQAARERLRKFEEFCKNETKSAADKAASEFKQLCGKYETAPAIKTQLDAATADIASLPEGDRVALAEAVTRLDELLARVKEAIAKGAALPPGQAAAHSTKLLSELVGTLEDRAKSEEGADDPATRAKLLQEKAEIEARQWLATVLTQAEEQVDRYTEKERLTVLLRDTNTIAITQKSTELTKQLITDRFCERFNEELTGLGLTTLTVELKSIQGAKGQTSFGLRMPTAVQGLPLREVASEGEQRCMTLALFLAELSTASHKSALVFDDPVSSLDQGHRNRIARRLAKEALTRQVIVLTHDAVFVNDLKEEAHRLKQPAEFRTIHWGVADNTTTITKPGAVTDGLPWEAKSTVDRIEKLRQVQSKLAKSWGTPMPTVEQVGNIKTAYNWLRATVERLVEHEVFGNVVYRYRTYINLKNLHKAIGFTQAEHDRITALFQRACDVTDAHDPAAGNPSPAPTPTDLLTDINELADLHETIRKRANANPSP